MEQRERTRSQEFTTVEAIFSEGDGGDDQARGELGSLLAAANSMVADRISANSRRYIRSSGQQSAQ